MPVIGFLNSQSPEGYAERLRGFRQGLKGYRLCRGRERSDRIPLGRQSNRSIAGACSRIGSPPGHRDRCDHSGYRSRVWVLEELIRHAKARGNVWFATHADIVRFARDNAQ
jgi:hypothetical protein